MGCDGGSIPRRDELVKLKKKAEKPDPNEVERIKWTSCAISKEPLKEPIVTCELGFLYNKEAVIRHLLEKTLDESFKHIRSLKDLMPVRFTPNPAISEKPTNGEDSTKAPFVCPITLDEVGRHHFSLLKSCGCALSERALHEIPSTTCLQCGKPFTASDVMPLNPSPEELVELRKGMGERRTAEKQERREKKEKRREGKKTNGKDTVIVTDVPLDGADKVDRAKSKAKILAEREQKKRPLADTTTTTTTTTSSIEPPAKVAKSSAYTSIFTSSIKVDPNARMQETFMCRNVLRG